MKTIQFICFALFCAVLVFDSEFLLVFFTQGQSLFIKMCASLALLGMGIRLLSKIKGLSFLSQTPLQSLCCFVATFSSTF